MTRSMVRSAADRLQCSPVLYLADQALSSGTNFLAVVLVAHHATPKEFGLFSILLVTIVVLIGFNRSVPHAIAMTLEWHDERGRSGYFFLPPLAAGGVATVALMAAYAVVARSWIALPLLLVPMLLQDAVRMHSFALDKPWAAVVSDAVWLGVEAIGLLFVSTAAGAAALWGIGGLCALLVTRPWRIRLRLQRRPIRGSAFSAAFEYATLTGLGYLTPLLAAPIITVVGIGALQGSNVIRGPIILLLQGLVVHRMSGPPITTSTCMVQAFRLSAVTVGVTLLCIPPLLFLRGVYGPLLLGATWSQVEPLVVPTLLTLAIGSVAFGPATVARKMGRFALSAKLQGALAPLFLALPLAGAAADGTKGFLYATALAYAVFAASWWIVLPKVATEPATQGNLAVT